MGEEMFTPEKLKEMSDQAQKEIINEEIRAGKRVPYYGGPAPENFIGLPGETNEKAPAGAVKARPKNWRRKSEGNFEEYKKRRKDIFN